MKKFTHTELWGMLPCSRANDTPDTDAVLDEFTAELHNYCCQEKEPAARMRTLRFARIELIIAQQEIQNGAGKKYAHTNLSYPCRLAY